MEIKKILVTKPYNKDTYIVEVYIKTEWSDEIQLKLSEGSKEKILEALKDDIRTSMSNMVDSLATTIAYLTPLVIEHDIDDDAYSI